MAVGALGEVGGFYPNQSVLPAQLDAAIVVTEGRDHSAPGVLGITERAKRLRLDPRGAAGARMLKRGYTGVYACPNVTPNEVHAAPKLLNSGELLNKSVLASDRLG